jgi:hypothetical protein
VSTVELTKIEIEKLQEKLVIVYRFISQEKKYKKFYYEGIEVKDHLNEDSDFLNKLMNLDDSEELLKSCIIELEEMKSNGKSLSPAEFQEFMLEQDWNQLYKKNGMKTLEDVGKLDLDMLMELL